MSWKMPDFKSKASQELLRRGIVFPFMTPKQREFFEHVEKSNDIYFGLLSSRKVGKSFSAMMYAYSQAIKRKNIIIRYVLPTFKNAKDVMYPIIRELQDIFPKDVQPVLKRSEATLYFKTGSTIILAGSAKDQVDSSRGPRADLIFLDESGAYDEEVFMYFLYSILWPQTSLVERPKIIATLTPAKSPQNPFYVYEIPKLQAAGNLHTFTIWDNPLLSDEKKQEIVANYGGVDNPDFRREYLAEMVIATDAKVIPEYNESTHVYFGNKLEPLKNVIGELDQYDCIISADLGVTDLTAIVAIFINTFTKKAIVTHEVALHGNTLKEFADAYLKIYNEVKSYASNVTSIADCWEQSFITLRKDYNLCLQRPTKRPIEDTVALIRHFFSRNVILIHEDCKCLRKQAEFCMFDENKTVTKDIARSTIPELGHGDHLMALAYGLRRVNFNTSSTNQIKLGRYK